MDRTVVSRGLGPIPTRLPVGPDTMSWRVSREPALLMGGGRALLLQVTHPSVGAGVEQHSNYQADPWSRLFSTLDTVFRMMFGTPEQSEQAGARLHRRHLSVNGVASDGTAYDALDPDLLLWVWATLVDTGLGIYERCFGELSLTDRQRYLDEQKLLAIACGVPAGACPDTYREFVDYVETVIETRLSATPTALEVAAQLRRPPLPKAIRGLAAAPITLVTAGTLPPQLRAALGFAWGPRHDKAFHAFFAATLAQRLVPRGLREYPITVASRRETPLRPPTWLVGKT
jgi:uncharacterized protein (DUF2236 family)